MEPLERTRFATTHWSAVLAARRNDSPEARQALEDLCRAYWFPLYAFVRRLGHDGDEAQDLTQEFFARLIARRDLAQVDPAKGRFRSFLLASLRHFLANEYDRASAQKRGAGAPTVSLDRASAETFCGSEPAELLTPEMVFERRWAVALLDRVLDGLKREYEVNGQLPLFEALKSTLVGDHPGATYAEIGRGLGMSEGAVKVAVHRLRARYRERLRAEVALTVDDPREIDDEIRWLFAAFRGPARP